jgi:hypothetical protein
VAGKRLERREERAYAPRGKPTRSTAPWPKAPYLPSGPAQPRWKIPWRRGGRRHAIEPRRRWGAGVVQKGQIVHFFENRFILC